jgi:hypothetical protein
MFEKRLIWCAIFATTCLFSFVSPAADPGAKNNSSSLEDDPDYSWVEKRFDEAYREAIAQANPHQRAVFEKEHAKFLREREALRNDPDEWIAYTQQEIRYFAGNYNEP